MIKNSAQVTHLDTKELKGDGVAACDECGAIVWRPKSHKHLEWHAEIQAWRELQVRAIENEN